MSDQAMSMVEPCPVPKTAQAGTAMFRRADVRQRIMRLRKFNREAMKLALKEGRTTDADIHLGKVRTLVSLLNELDKLPLFENPVTIEALSPIGAALRGVG